MGNEILKIIKKENQIHFSMEGDAFDVIHALSVVACQSPSFKMILKTALEASELDDIKETFEESSFNESYIEKIKTVGDA